MNIVLTGPMGSGKTAVGKIIAEKLSMDFIDSDDEIIRETGYSIPEIFNQFGEQFFRQKEEEIMKQAGEARIEALNVCCSLKFTGCF